MKPALNDWVCAAPIPIRSTLRAANRLSEVPACSNRVQNTTATKISTIASIIRSRSILSHLAIRNHSTKPSDRKIAPIRPMPTRSLRCTRNQTGITPRMPPM